MSDLDFETVGLGAEAVDYLAAWDLQRDVHAAVVEGDRPDTVLLLEHPPTITLGRRTEEDEVHVPDDAEVAVVKTDRGGRSTYHGPGQLVCYPILDLGKHGKDVKRYVRDLEEALVSLGFGRFFVAATRETALLMPDATPACCAPMAFITVVVSGATVMVMPTPSTMTAGRNVVAYARTPGSMPGHVNSPKPAAAINGPTTSGFFGPNRSTSVPAQREPTNMIAMNGSNAAPAAVAP